MNNDLHNNDPLYEHGYDVRLGRAAPTEAMLSVSSLYKDTTPSESAASYGPFCTFSYTLPYKIPLRREPDSPRWSVAVPDVCYWTPNLPFHYRLTLQLNDGRELTTWVALKRFGVKGKTLSMDGERYVLRGFSTRGLELSATDDAAWQTLREQRAVLVMQELDPEIVMRAGWAGLPVIWDQRETRVTSEQLLAARGLPAVMGIIAAQDCLRDPNLLQAANELLWIVEGHDEQELLEYTDERTQVTLLTKPSPRMTMPSQIPLIISIPITGNPPLADRRTFCDELQAQTAEVGSFAGYLLL